MAARCIFTALSLTETCMSRAKDSVDFARYISHVFIDPDSIKAINPLDILFVDSVSNEYYLKFSNIVIVQYDRTPQSAYYLSEKGPVQGLNDKGFTAYFSLVNDKVGIDSKGVIDEPLFVIYDGFWVYEKLANQLPVNYQPEQ